jgi:hypothetical protein
VKAFKSNVRVEGIFDEIYAIEGFTKMPGSLIYIKILSD